MDKILEEVETLALQENLQEDLKKKTLVKYEKDGIYS